MHLSVQENASEIVDSIVNSSIFGSFESFAPFPIIILALLTTYALCSAGNYYESIMKGIDGCYVLFAKMLSAVMYTLPVFAFLAMLDVLLMSGMQASLFLFCLTVTMPLSMVAMALFYSLRLIRAGINPGPFAEKRALKQKQQN